ncbi:MAG: hypothetical protein JSU94_19205 [Phycisphaerales bacterium]|nr:MAG: hypothetical protein JSU94_19205 [Phycisphaerales bacterium]
MNLEEKIKTLAARARAEVVPRVNVAGGVLNILAREQSETLVVYERPWMWLAAVSSAVAVPAAVLAIIVYLKSADPVMQVVQSISWAVQ